MKNLEIKGTIVSDNMQEIYDYYGIGAVSPALVKKALNEANGEDITLEINSGGGDLVAGNEIYYTLKKYQGNVISDIIYAASAATTVALGADKVRMTPNGMFMIHNASCYTEGDYREMDKTSDILKTANKAVAKAYQLKTGKGESEILALMDNETWLTAQSAHDLGFVDEIINDLVPIYNSLATVVTTEMIKQYRNTLNNPRADNLALKEEVEIKINLLKLRRKIK